MSGSVFVIGLGCWCLGAVIGGIVAHYIANVREFTLRGMTATVAVLGGAGVIGVFQLMGTPPTTAFWMYPVGLLVGLGMVASWNVRDQTGG
ncbi:MAG: hypothetical protein JSS36_06090 [Proteobacteria bacterium]|nr:hypothetical protein [Pseudomonadota bacterium]